MADIILKDINGVEQLYSGVNIIKIPNSNNDGYSQFTITPNLQGVVSQAPSSEGEIEVVPAVGYDGLSEVIIQAVPVEGALRNKSISSNREETIRMISEEFLLGAKISVDIPIYDGEVG